MGVHFPLSRHAPKWEPWRWTLSWLVLYAASWIAIDQFAIPPGASQPKLVSLLAWGGCYFAGATYLARGATLRIRETVKHDILPYASERYKDAVAIEIHDRFTPNLLLGLPLLVAGVSLALAWWAIGQDMGRGTDKLSHRDLPELLFWAGTYFIYFFTAAIAVIAGRFYSSFAGNLGLEKSSFYVLGASDTPLVKGLSKLGSQVLIFWALIFLLILSGMLLAFVPPKAYRLDPDSQLLFLLVPIAGFFSLGFGSLIYLGSEARIRSTLHRFTHAQARLLQKKSNALIYPSRGLVSDVTGEAERLTEWQDRILAGGRYGSRAGAGLSIALPLTLPALSLIINLIK